MRVGTAKGEMNEPSRMSLAAVAEADLSVDRSTRLAQVGKGTTINLSTGGDDLGLSDCGAKSKGVSDSPRRRQN